MKNAVLDTSALVRLYVPDGPIPKNLESTIEEAYRSEARLLAPELMAIEFAQTLRKKEQKGYLSAAEVDEIIASSSNLPIHYVSHQGLIEEAVTVARTASLTVYDAIYLVVTAQVNGVLISADMDLLSALEKTKKEGK